MTRTALAVCIALALPAVAAAEPGARREAAADRAALHDDLRDSQQAEELLHEFDRAVAERRWLGVAVVEGRVTTALRQELDEANRETGQAAREADRSRDEVRRDHAEVASDARRGDRREFHEDRRDLKDDRRDAAKDRHDLMEKADYRKRIQALSGEWTRLRGLRRPGILQRKHDILVELVALSRREIRSDMGELREDRGERREDWRDRHEDRH